MKDHLSDVDSANAKASMAQDEEKVKNMIRKDVGFDAVDARIKQFLVKWMAVEVQAYMNSLITDSSPAPKSSLLSCDEVEPDTEEAFEEDTRSRSQTKI